MLYRKNDEGFRVLADGIRMKCLVHGVRTSLCEFRLAAGSSLPLHHHPHEQTGYVVSGRIRMTAGDEVFEAGPGDSWCIPGDLPHRADVLTDAVIVEVFSPVREDYLA